MPNWDAIKQTRSKAEEDANVKKVKDLEEQIAKLKEEKDVLEKELKEVKGSVASKKEPNGNLTPGEPQ